MISEDSENIILDYIGIKPTKRCKATTLHKKMCKHSIRNKKCYNRFICKQHTNKLYKNSNKDNLFINFILMVDSQYRYKKYTKPLHEYKIIIK